MGMLGALAGFGQGLQDYSKVLQKKQEQDWLDQQARVKYEREQNLESLRMRNQKEMQQAGFTHAETMQSQQNAAADARFNKTFGLQEKQFGLQQAEAEANAQNRAEALAIQKQQLSQQGAFQSAHQEVYAAQAALLKEQTDQLKKTGEEREAFLATLTPEQRAIVAAGKQLPSLSPEEVKFVAESASLEYERLTDPKNKEELATKAAAIAKASKGQLTIPEVKGDLRNLLYYKGTRDALFQKQGRLGGDKTPADDGAAPSNKRKEYIRFRTPEEQERAKQDYIDGKMDPKVWERLTPSLQGIFGDAKRADRAQYDDGTLEILY